MQNKCIRFSLKLDKMNHVYEECFITINQLHFDQRVQQSLNIRIFKYVNNAYLYFRKEVFKYASQGRINSSNNYAKFKALSRKAAMGQNVSHSKISSVWKKLPSSMKRNISLNMFKLDVKKTLLTSIKDVMLLLSLSL